MLGSRSGCFWAVLLVVSGAALGCGKTGRGNERGDRLPQPPAATAGGGSGGSGGSAGSAVGVPDENPDENGGQGGASEPTCFDTPREPEDDAINATTLEMASLAPPDRLVPIMIGLVRIDFDFSTVSTGKPREQLIEERKQQLEPYQTPILQRLAALGAEQVGTSWLINSVSASLAARNLPDVLCWPNVVKIEVDGGYWTIAEPPWSAAEAGPAQCPLIDGECPEHCFDVSAAKVVNGVACGMNREAVACSREPYGIDDAEPSCRQSTESGERYVFRGLVPDPPDYVGFEACAGPAPEYVDDCVGGAGSE